MKHTLHFHTQAKKQLDEWQKANPIVFKKIGELLKSIDESPTTGIGKPEALSGNWKGFWSRKITKKDRLIYRVRENVIEVASCKFHYDDK